MEVGVVWVDGTKIAAAATHHQNRSYRQIAEEILEEAGEIDAAEDELFGDARGDELPEGGFGRAVSGESDCTRSNTMSRVDVKKKKKKKKMLYPSVLTTKINSLNRFFNRRSSFRINTKVRKHFPSFDPAPLASTLVIQFGIASVNAAERSKRNSCCICQTFTNKRNFSYCCISDTKGAPNKINETH